MSSYQYEHSSQVPKHLALLMDGNGRWAQARGLSRTDGHRAGAENMMWIVRSCCDIGIEYLTLYLFSTENWKRPPSEVDGMMHLVDEFLDRELSTIHAWNIRLVHLGRIQGISPVIARKIRHALELTRANSGMTLAVALNYGSRADILDAVRSLMAQGVAPELITEHMIAAHLSTASLPPPDLVIRTSGEQRLSNFLLWESVHSTFYTTNIAWPDFTPEHLFNIIHLFDSAV